MPLPIDDAAPARAGPGEDRFAETNAFKHTRRDCYALV